MRLTRSRLSLLALTLLAACDVPTGVPYYDTQWNVPGKSTTISVNSFLPSGVTALADNSAFRATLSPATVSITRSLGQDCAACAAANGQTIPKPAFTGGASTTLSLPSSVASAALVHDTLTLVITNGYGFDPLRPSASARGYLTISVTSGAAVVGTDSVDGSATALPSGGTLTRKIPLAGSVSGSIQVASKLSSPLGDPVTINTAQTLGISGGVGLLYLSSATVNLASQSVTSSPTDIDLSGISSTVSDHSNGGELYLTLTNPFGVSGNLTVNLTTDRGSTIQKSIQLATGTSSPMITFTKQELDALLGSDVTMTFTGTVAGAGVTVTPGQSVAVSSRLQIDISTGGNN